jgi:hypothetical protein
MHSPTSIAPEEMYIIGNGLRLTVFQALTEDEVTHIV